MEEIKQLVEELNQAFMEHKVKNDQRLTEIQEKGYADPVLEQQVDRVAKEIQNLTEVKARLERVETKLERPALDQHLNVKADQITLERKEAVVNYLRKGEGFLTPQEIKLLATDSDPDGGYWMTSEISNQAIQKVFETSPMRNIATVETISTDALEIPEDLNEADSGWTSERSTRTETNTPQIGVRRIPVHELYAMPKATQTLLDDSRIDVESWLSMKIADKMARIENSAFLNGDGVGKPRGILTYTSGTSNPGQVQQVNSQNASALTADGLRALFYTLKGPYIPNARWLMSRSAIEEVSKLKDSAGSYIWQPGFQEGEPQTLLGHPIERMEDMPQVAANSLSIAFGDFKQAYTIVDRMGLRVLRDPFSSKPFVLFYTTKRTGADVANFEAFAIQKTAA
ncbi:MAG: phage major capsid protein [Nitrospina sp.]|nr:phage major capsid protein [Nitrospina sp.]MBT5631992.1 phage major capsid protein [Nitrospina sp.]